MKYSLIVLVCGVLSFSLLSSSCNNKKKTANLNQTEETAKEKKPKPEISEKTIPEVEVDPIYTTQETDSFTLLESSIEGDNLILLVRYGGGCEEHVWNLKTNGAYAKSMPPQITLNLEHNANRDMCRALLTDTLEFNLKPIRYNGSLELDVKLFGFPDRKMRYHY